MRSMYLPETWCGVVATAPRAGTAKVTRYVVVVVCGHGGARSQASAAQRSTPPHSSSSVQRGPPAGPGLEWWCSVVSPGEPW